MSEEKPQLVMTDEGLTLMGDGLSLRGDFRQSLKRLKQSNLEREFLVKAARIKNATAPLYAIDATAGLGEDSILLAAAGFKVLLCEKDPIIAALLRDALERGAKDPDLAEIVSRMELREGDSVAYLNELGEGDGLRRPDVVVLDPMFPKRQKSAAVKKKFQLLQQIEPPESAGEVMLEAAIKAHPKKIVIKRPLKGPFLGNVKPGYSITGKAIRYDCIVLP